MKKKIIFCFGVFLLCVATAFYTQLRADATSSQTRTYYYELVKVVDENGKVEERSEDGQFYTITHNTCYESNNKGMDEGIGHLAYVGENEEMKLHVYSGTSFYGKETTFYFQEDYSRINVKTAVGMTYVLARKSAPKEFVASNHKAVKQWIESIMNGGAVPSMPATTYSTSTTDNSTQTTTPRRCPGCNGTGYCSMCKGKGWYRFEGKDYDCPACHRSGRCGVCHGKGHCN